MAKPKTPSAPARTKKERDAATEKKIVTLATDVAKRSLAGNEPTVRVPTRTKSNTLWNKKKGILQMGPAAQERGLFNLSQAKSFMQTMLHSSSIKDLIAAEKTLSLRGMFYKGLHTVAGTKEKTFADQDESDGILEDLEVSLAALREELHIFAKKAGTMVGNITIIDSGDEIDCRRMGSGGYAIPSIVEPDVIKFKKCDAKFVLHVEKNTVWSRFNEDRFWEKHNCILTEGGGQPPRGSKAESIAARLGGVIRLKGVLAHLRRQSWASVFRINSSTAGVLAPAFGRLGVHRKFQCPGAVLGEVLHGLH